MEKYKELVEQDKGYAYIGSIRKKDNKKYRWYLKVKHLYCGCIHEVRIEDWKQDKNNELGNKPYYISKS